MVYGILSICDIIYILNIQNESQNFNRLTTRTFPVSYLFNFSCIELTQNIARKHVVPSHAKLFLTSTNGKLSKRL